MSSSKVVRAKEVYWIDYFTRADSSYPGLGAGWLAPAWEINTNRAFRNGSGPSDYGVYLKDLGSPDHGAGADMVGQVGGQYWVVNVRRTADNAETGYLGFFNPDNLKWTIGKAVSGVYTELVQSPSSGATPYTAHVRLEAEGTALRLYADGVLKAFVNDSTITTGNYAGINANTGGLIDNFLANPLDTSGFLWYPGTVNNYARNSRASQSVFTHLGFTVRVRPEAMDYDRPMAGWYNAFAALRLYTDNTLYIATQSGGVQGGAKSDVIPFNPIGKDVWFKGEVRVSDAQCSYWYSLDDVEDPAFVTWTALGTPIGSRAGLTPSTSNSNLLTIGATTPTGVTGVFRGRIYYMSEQFNQVDNAVFNFHTATSLPAGVSLLNTGTVPGVTLYPETSYDPELYKEEWIGDKRVWPISDGYFKHGVAAGGNYSAISAPDVAAYTTTDLDVRWFGLIDWTRSGGFFNQWDTAGNQRAWLMEMGGGQTRLSFSTTGGNQYMSALINIPFAAGVPGGIRFTRLQSSGLTRLWFSTDGITWVENVAGQTVMAAATAMFDSTAPLLIGAYNSLGSAGQVVGSTYWAELRAGINGSVLYRVGPQSFRNIAQKQASWTCETGQTVTRVGGASPTPWIYPTVDVEDVVDRYMGDTRTWPGGDGYAELPGIADNCLSIPHSPDLGITGDICIVAGLALSDWSPATNMAIANKGYASNDRSWLFLIQTDGSLRFDWAPDAVGGLNIAGSSPGVLPTAGAVAGKRYWVGVTLDVDNGSANSACRFWTSPDNVIWTQLGNVYNSGSVTAINNSTAPLQIGEDPTATSAALAGNVFYASVRSGIGSGGTIGGTEVFHLDRDSFKVGRRSTTVPVTTRVTNPVAFSNYVGIRTTPDPGVPPDQFILVARLTAGPNLSGGGIRTVCSHGASTPNYAWRLLFVDSSLTAKTWRVVLSADGTAVTNFSIASLPPWPEGVPYSVAFSMEKIATDWKMTHYDSPDGTTWTNRGTVTVAFGTIFDTAADLSIGASSSAYLGDIQSLEMRTGLDPAAGSILWKLAAAESTMPAATWRQPGVTDFDSDGITDGWVAYQVGTATSTKREVVAGVQYLEAQLETNLSWYGASGPRFAVLPSTTYQFSAYWFISQAATNVTFNWRARFFDAGGTFLSEQSITNISGGSGTPESVTNTFITTSATYSVEIVGALLLTPVSTLSVAKGGFYGVRTGRPSSYVDPRGRTWTDTNAGSVGQATTYQSANLAVNKSGTPSTQIYPSVVPYPARWDEAQWDDGSDWS